MTTAEYRSPLAAGEAHDAEIIAEVERAPEMLELGTTGLKRVGGYVDEEFLPQLRGRKAVSVYKEMGDNDPIAGAMLFAIVQLCRNAQFSVKPGGKTVDHANGAKLIDTAMQDMSHTWGDFVAEAIMGKIQYGWSWHEVALKRRGGMWSKDPATKSRYADDLIGWKRLPVRSQDTLQRWVFDDLGDVIGLVQQAPPDYKQRYIPLSRSVLFRHGIHKGNPEGRSILRNSYRPWFYKKRLEEFESVGVERDLAGLPMVTVPSDYLRASKGTEQAKMVDAMKRMVRAIRRNEQEGLVFPASYDPDTKEPLFKFELLGSGGARQFSTNELITRYEQRQLMTILADWIMVGHSKTGTYNLHVDKTGIFRAAINQTVQSFIDELNRSAVPALFLANGWRPAELPEIIVSDVDAPDLGQLGAFMAQTSQLGFTWGPDADVERYLRNAAGIPELTDDDYAKRRRLSRKTEATAMAETETAYLAARSQLAQAKAEAEMQATGEPTPEEAQQLRAQGQEDAATAQGDEQHATAQQQARQGMVETARQGRLAELAAANGGPSGNSASGQAARGSKR